MRSRAVSDAFFVATAQQSRDWAFGLAIFAALWGLLLAGPLPQHPLVAWADKHDGALLVMAPLTITILGLLSLMGLLRRRKALYLVAAALLAGCWCFVGALWVFTSPGTVTWLHCVGLAVAQLWVWLGALHW